MQRKTIVNDPGHHREFKLFIITQNPNTYMNIASSIHLSSETHTVSFGIDDILAMAKLQHNNLEEEKT